jgi:hypothetical protein
MDAAVGRQRVDARTPEQWFEHIEKLEAENRQLRAALMRIANSHGENITEDGVIYGASGYAARSLAAAPPASHDGDPPGAGWSE